MSDAALSQDELESLLEGVAPEEASAPEWGTAATADGIGAVAGSFDTAVAGRFGNGRLPTLHLINERFIELFDAALHRFTSRRTTISADAPAVMKYGAFAATLATPTSLNVVRMGPSCGNGLFVFDAGLLYFVIDSLFGGDGTIAAVKSGRHFTTTEQRLIGRLCDLVFASYGKAWEPVHPMHFELLRSESEARFVNLCGPEDPVLAFGFRISCANGSNAAEGSFRLCMPLSAIDPVRDVMAREVREKTSASDSRWSERLAVQVAAAEVELVAELASVPVTCRELVEMKAGDVIMLDIKPSIVASVDGVPVLRARYGNAEGRYAIRVDEIIVPMPA